MASNSILDVKDFTAWKVNEAFSCYAMTTGRGVHVALGVDGHGNYAVKEIKKGVVTIEVFQNPSLAMDKYSNLISALFNK